MKCKGIIIFGWLHPKNHHGLVQGCRLLNLPLKFATVKEELSDPNYNLLMITQTIIDPKTFSNDKFIIFGPHFQDISILCNSFDEKSSNTCFNCLSQWNNDRIKEECINSVSLVNLPFGVDTDRFRPQPDPKDTVLIYLKSRITSAAASVVELLRFKGYNRFEIVKYGLYTEQNYLDVLKRAKFGVWIGCHESQGFALQEALSSDVPLVVWNVKSMHEEVYSDWIYPHGKNPHKLIATSIPYWSDKCGEVAYTFEEVDLKIDDLIKNLDLGKYKPREYILERLNFERCVKDMIKIME